MTQKSKNDRVHEYKLLILGFFLTSIIGGLITFSSQSFQERQKIEADRRADYIKIMEQRREQATILFNELSVLIDTRLYNWRRLSWALEDDIYRDSINKRYYEYQDIFLKWNHSLNKNRALVCRFFGANLGDLFDRQIMPMFRELHDTIIKVYRMPRTLRQGLGPIRLNYLADSLNNIVAKFNDSMAELIRSGKVGLTDPGNACGN